MAQAAGKAILPHFRAPLDVANKGGARGYDPVTVADRAGEEVIRARIARAYPDHGIRGEELGWQKGASPYTWVIDPIDGTRSFILGQMHWATLIALNDGTRVVAGMAHQPYVGETFIAKAGGSRMAASVQPTRLPRAAAQTCGGPRLHGPTMFRRRERRAPPRHQRSAPDPLGRDYYV
jgi:myo-inositol-1(or 4)-monophosphatase